MAQIQDRTFQFACGIVRLHDSLLKRRGAVRVLSNQLLRSGTSLGANLEEATGAQSKPDFVSKCRIALKEGRESHYWLRLIAATTSVQSDQIKPLVREANEIVAVLTSIVKKATKPDKK